MKRSTLFVALLGIVGCTDKAPPRAQPATVIRQRTATIPGGQADSARAFVQRFYDWYLTTQANKGAPYDSLLAGQRAWLSDSLAAAFAADVAAQRADTVGEIASLSSEADVFLNSQDPCQHYQPGSVRAIAPSAFLVSVHGDCPETSGQGSIEVYVRQGPIGWQIANIKDPNGSLDLLRDLIQYHAGDSLQRAPHAPSRDSARHDSA